MNCTPEKLYWLYDGELPEAEAADLRTHLNGCGRCAVEWREIRQLGTLVQELPEVAPPADLRESILAAVSGEVPAEADACARVLPLLNPYIDNELGLAQRGEVDQHRAVCAACDRAFAEMEAYRSLFQSVREVRPPASLRRAIYAEVGLAQPTVWARLRAWFAPPPRRAWAPALALAAISVVLFGLLIGPSPREVNLGEGGRVAGVYTPVKAEPPSAAPREIVLAPEGAPATEIQAIRSKPAVEKTPRSRPWTSPRRVRLARASRGAGAKAPEPAAEAPEGPPDGDFLRTLARAAEPEEGVPDGSFLRTLASVAEPMRVDTEAAKGIGATAGLVVPGDESGVRPTDHAKATASDSNEAKVGEGTTPGAEKEPEKETSNIVGAVIEVPLD